MEQRGKDAEPMDKLSEQIAKLDELHEKVLEVGYILDPMMYVTTQSGRSLVPVDWFYAESVDTEEYLIVSSHRAPKTWTVLGCYQTKERAIQVYNEMLYHSKTKKYEVYEMPKE